MGRAAMVWVMLGWMALSTLALGIATRNSQAADDAVNGYIKERTKNIAASGAEIYGLKVAKNSVGIPGMYAISPIMDGVDSVFLSKNAGGDTLFIRSIATLLGYKDSVVVCFSSGSPNITGAFGISSSSTNAYLKITGAGSITDGRNYDPLTGLLDASSPDVHGITYELRSDLTTLGFKTVKGSSSPTGTPPDTLAVGSSQPNYDYLPALLVPLATRIVTSAPGSAQVWGTWAIPEITVVDNFGSCSKSIDGVGILIVKGSVSFTAPMSWKGLVIVASEAGKQAYFKPTQVNGYYGAIIMTGPAPKWDQSNNGYYYYSAAALQHVFGSFGIGYKLATWWE